jgi:hypothetical protein
MYHLLVSFTGWENRGSLAIDRVFEYTQDKLVNIFKPNGNLDQSKISQIPALFASEISGDGTQFARIGYIQKIENRNKEVYLDYHFEPDIPLIANTTLQEMASELGIEGFELFRTHWAIKDVDLFRVLLKRQPFVKISPKVFKLDEFNVVDNNLVSVMMPFASQFDKVYETLQNVSSNVSMNCLRADDIWEAEAIIQDVVSLIYRSRVVVCDCTGRNPNVFYEAGIAHTLGKDVILITQSDSDIPFDLRHLRFVTYLNNNEGRIALAEKLSQRIQTLLNRTYARREK